MQPLPSLPDTPESHKLGGDFGNSPPMVSPEKGASSTPSPTTPKKYRTIVPKGHTIFVTSPLKCPSPIQQRSLKKSPRRQILQQKARAIMPKGYTGPTFTITSPVKMVAANITAKAKRGKLSVSPLKGTHVRRILPKPPQRDIISPPRVTFQLSPRGRKTQGTLQEERASPGS